VSAASVGGIVLAAGRSSRMGRPKGLLPIDDATFLERSIGVLAEGGCAPVVAVVPAGEAGEEMADLAERAGAAVVRNPNPGSEQVDSLRLGLATVGACDAVVVALVDYPLARAASVEAVVRAFRRRHASIVRPTHDGRPGHPVLFARGLWPELTAPDLAEGARDVVHRHHADIVEVPVDDRGVEVDVDTPEDYREEVGE